MTLLLSLATAVVFAPLQKPDPARAPTPQIPRIEGIPSATKLLPLKGAELDASKMVLIKFRPVVPAFVFTKDLRAEAKTRTGLPREQGNRPTGTLHAVTFCAEFVASKKMGVNNLNLSEEFMNAVANAVGGNVQDGDHLFNAFKAYMTAGVCREPLMPYRPNYVVGLPVSAPARADALIYRKGAPVWVRPFGTQVTVPPQNLPGQPGWPVVPGQGITPPMLNAMKMHLSQGFPVAVTIRWPAEAAMGTVDVAGIDLFRMPSLPQAPYSKGVALVGFKDDGRFPGGGLFVFRNSDGVDWGDQGYGYISYAYIRNLTMGALVLR